MLDPLAAAAGAPLVGPVGRAARGLVSRERRRRIAAAGDPLVSVVMAARNAEATLEAALGSLQTQSYAGLEILVIDDASDDDTAALARRTAQTDDRVRVISLDSARGAAGARNVGLAEARGQYVTFQDADDRSLPDRVERQLAVHVRDRAAQLVMCRYRRVDAAGRTVAVNGRAYRKCIIAMMFPREVIERVGYFRSDLSVGEDSELYERIKTVWGETAERRLWAPLYEARFDRDSLLFSAGEVSGTREVRYEQAPEHVAEQARWREAHAAIRRGERDPFVSA